MTTTDNVSTWRDLVDQLTDDQFIHLEHMERTALSDPTAVAAGLLELAREHAHKNLDDDAQFGHLPTPAGARKVYHWEAEEDGKWSRQLSDTERRIGMNEARPGAPRINVDVDGVQHSDGSMNRTISVDARAAELNSEQARALAAVLMEAADELDRLR